DGIRDKLVTGVQTCALPISEAAAVAVIEQMRTGAFDALAATFDSSMAANVSADSIRKAWEGATGQFGNWVNTGKGLVVPVTGARSEERRVGKEWRWRW